MYCLRSKDGFRLVDDNTILFVAIHELGHVMTKEQGHVPPFWDNMKFLLKIGIKLASTLCRLQVKIKNIVELKLLILRNRH